MPRLTPSRPTTPRGTTRPGHRFRTGLTALAATAVAGSAAAAQAPTLSRVAVIGCEDCGDARQFASTWDVAVDDSGNVLVADRDAPTLRLFDRSGSVRWTRGRPGAGPGEYRYTMRVAIDRAGGVQAVDMRLRRLTRLAADGRVAESLTIPFFPAGVAARGRTGELLFLTDDFKGNGTIERWAPTAATPRRVATVAMRVPGTGTFSPSIAAAPNGMIAIVATGDAYVIHRFDENGRPLGDLARDIPRPRRTAEEIAAIEQRRLTGPGGAKSAAERTQAPSRSVLGPTEDRLAFKPHMGADALRYDDTGRLWVRAERGTSHTTVFDVFASAGSYLGEVTVPFAVSGFAMGGPYLAVAAEREDGIPVIALYQVR